MTSAPVSGTAREPRGRGEAHSRLARWAVASSAVFGAAIAAIVIGWAAGGDSFMDNNLWFSWTVLLLGLAAGIAACLMAIVAMLKGEVWALLWVPLCAFPALVVLVVVGEAFIWE